MMRRPVPRLEHELRWSDTDLLEAFFETIENKLVAQTTEKVLQGAALAGAAIYKKEDLSLQMTGTNDWRLSPLLHGETHCIQEFFLKIPKEKRPHPKDCVFLTTHEPCPLCLSAITWSGFDNFYYFFSHEDSRDLFGDPYDKRIIEQVFKIQGKGESPADYAARPIYRRDNMFWKSRYIADMVDALPEGDQKDKLKKQEMKIRGLYDEMFKKSLPAEWPPIPPCEG
ncbi:hypothetical protein MNV49_001687 [Pseudohyphozyma bogoriensis]|nr:hypothetical protein MNV49_001687 [Pseudohyphozyma bogoriensis]